MIVHAARALEPHPAHDECEPPTSTPSKEEAALWLRSELRRYSHVGSQIV